MTAMIEPPIAAGCSFGWRQVFGFGQPDGPLFAEVRGSQIMTALRYAPFNIAVLTFNMGILTLWLNATAAGPDFLFGWNFVMAGLALVWTIRWWRERDHRLPMRASRNDVWGMTAELVSFGIGWSVMVGHCLPTADHEQQALLLVSSLTAMGACGFAAAALPVGGIALVLTIAGTTLLSIPEGSPLATLPVSVSVLAFAGLIVRGMLINCHALMARLQADANLADRTATMALLLDDFEASVSDWLIEVDAAGRLVHVAPRFAEVAGVSVDALLGRGLCSVLLDWTVGEGRGVVAALQAQFAARRGMRDLTIPVRIGAEDRWWAFSATPKFADDGSFLGFRGVGRDITEVKRSSDRIAELARFDPLTGLANRSLFRETLDDALARAVRTQKSCALLFVDLDRFKAVNDGMGHQAGDRLLREAATRLRQAAGSGASVGRLGGDEFAVILPIASPRRAETVARAIVAALSRPFEIDAHVANIGASVGFAIGPGDGASCDALLKSADLALHEVKSGGRGAACRFIPEIGLRFDERRALERDLALALDRGELALHFQPVVAAADEHITGFEALLRWNHPRLGSISPARFIPIAEETGAIVDIGHFVIETACAWAARWPEAINIAVNLSPAQFEDPALVATVARALADYRIAPARLELEITESLFLNEKATTIERLAGLKALGVRFALDDFGTGYSSLGHLQKVSFSRIKIDRSFVARLCHGDGEATAIVQAVVGLANSLDMTTTAEGAETRAEFEAVRALGCAEVQGYYFGRPMPAEAATALVCGERLLEAAE